MGKQILVTPGDRFGRLTVIEEAERQREPSGRNVRCFLCRCECGAATTVTLGHLRNGNTKSCGCLRHDVGVQNGKASATHGCTGTPTFKSWDTMKQRCNNPNYDGYHRYGGRGIAVCGRWKKFENFLTDMGEKPEGMTLDRIDTNGNYEAGNCRWATPKQQGRNRRNNVMLTFDGETCCVGEWAERFGLGSGVLHQRIRRGWPLKEALMTPSYGRKTQ